MTFNVELSNMNLAADNLKEKAKLILWKSMHKMEEIAHNKCPFDTGRLDTSIQLFPKKYGADEYILACGAEYGIYVEYGTSPHWVPIAPLKGWAKRKLKDEGLAYAVQHKIAIEGTEAQPYFRPALQEVRIHYLPMIIKEVLGY